MKRLASALAATGLLMATSTAFAVTLPWTQSGLDTFNNEFGGATQYRAVAPANPLGLIGFDLGIEATTATIDGVQVIVPKIKLQKGLFAGFDVSGYYSQIPTSGIPGITEDGTMYGVALSYAILKGNTIAPALAVRGSYTQASIPNIVNTTTYGADLTVSKGFGPLTPYAGIGMVQMNSSDQDGSGTAFSSSAMKNRTFVGMGLDLLIMDLTFEADTTDGVNTYTVKAGFRFGD